MEYFLLSSMDNCPRDLLVELEREERTWWNWASSKDITCFGSVCLLTLAQITEQTDELSKGKLIENGFPLKGVSKDKPRRDG